MTLCITIIQNLVDDLPELKEKWQKNRVMLYQLTAHATRLKQMHNERTQEFLQHDPALSDALASSMAMEQVVEEMRQELITMLDGPVSTDQPDVFLDPEIHSFRKPSYPA
jgi:hypothetical protein